MVYWERNQKALGRWGRSLEAIEALETVLLISTDYQVTPTADGSHTLVYQGIALHHPEGAQTEAEQLADRDLHPEDHNIHVLFGLGLGYLLDACVQRSEGMIVVYEPHLPLLRFLLENVDYSDYFANPRVTLCTTPKQLERTIYNLMRMEGYLDGLMLPGYQRLFNPAQVQTAKKHMELAINERRAHFRIGLLLNLDWQSVIIRNVPNLRNACPFTPLADRHPQLPAIVISAGPSLDRYIEDLRRWQGHAVLIAVGAALKPLQTAGITPDYAAFLDYDGPQYQLTDVNVRDIQLLLGPFVHDCAWQVPCRQRYMMSFINYTHIANWHEQYTGVKSVRIPSGGTVSITAVNSALSMGCNPIILLGQDLAFAGTQQYAGNVHVELNEGAFTAPASHVHEGRTLQVATIRGQQGEHLFTSPDYVMFQKEFAHLAEQLHQATDQIRLINASIGGALLPGFEHRSLPEIAAHFDWARRLPMEKPLPLPTVEPMTTERFLPHLNDIWDVLERALREADALIEQQLRWKKALRNHGLQQARPAALDALQSRFVETLGESWVLYGSVGEDIWRWQEAAEHETLSLERVDREIGLVRQIQEKLRERILPSVRDSIAALAEQVPSV